jgi:ERCC4-type nuclease
VSTTKAKKISSAFPNTTPVSKEELLKTIKGAESGVFYSTEAVKKALNKWSKK